MDKRKQRRKLTAEEAEHAKSLYYTTDCSRDRIGRHFGVSGAVIAKIVDGTYKTAEQYKNYKPE